MMAARYPSSVGLVNQAFKVFNWTVSIRVLEKNPRNVFFDHRHCAEINDLDFQSHGFAAGLDAGDCLWVELVWH